jgi:hypothetical protein
VRPARHATIHGHLVEEFHWHDCPICYVDAHRVSGSFDYAVADLQAASRVLPGNRSENISRPLCGDNLMTGPLGV